MCPEENLSICWQHSLKINAQAHPGWAPEFRAGGANSHLLDAHPLLPAGGVQQQLSELFVIHSLGEIVQAEPGAGDEDILVLQFLMLQ